MKLHEFIDQCAARLQSDSPEAVRARTYLEQRGLRPGTIIELGLGYCDRSQVTPDNEPNGNLFYERFVVPIRSEFGEAVAVGARSPSKAESGWWNSSTETGFYKSEHLFLLDKARRSIFEANKAYLYEGYMDGIVVRQEGLPNVVAAMGTTLGLRQIGLLRRYCEEVCVCFDADQNEAGQVAEAKSVLQLAKAGYRKLNRIRLPIGVDPDEYVRQNQVSGLLALEQPLSNTSLEDYKTFLVQYRERSGRR